MWDSEYGEVRDPFLPMPLVNEWLSDETRRRESGLCPLPEQPYMEIREPRNRPVSALSSPRMTN